jgi:hypothetical protein
MLDIHALETIMSAGLVVHNLGIDHDTAWQDND